MNKTTLITIFLILYTICFADDTAINSYGGNLICIKETKISLKKEILTFTQTEKGMRVDIYFEFYNPDDARKILIGFVTPEQTAPEIHYDTEPNIEDFIAIVNDTIVAYKISKIRDSNFSSLIDQKPYGDYIYYFDAYFAEGINTIKHTYFFKPIYNTGGIYGNSYYKYKLTTGKNWANEFIEDFELIINKRGLYNVPLSLDNKNKVHWEIKGFGKIQKYSNEVKPQYTKLNVNIISGYLYYHATNFKPEQDLIISNYNPIEDYEILKTIYWSSMNRGYGLDKLTNEDYRKARNALFAIYGYKFKDNELLKHFSSYFWYIPDPNVKNNVDILNSRHKKLFERIMELENNINQNTNN